MITTLVHSPDWSVHRSSVTVERNIHYSYAEAALFSFMVGIGETYLAAFLLAGGQDRIHSGLVIALPLLFGAVAQVYLQRFSAKTSSRRWLVACITVQASAFVPLSVLAFAGKAPFIVVFVLASLYWGAGMSASPVWNFWIDGQIPPTLRPMFLAVRSRISQIAILLGFISGGILLQIGRQTQREMLAFGFVFGLAAVARYLSADCLRRQTDSPDENKEKKFYSWSQFMQRCRGTELGRFCRFLFIMQGAVYVAGPFFTPYMLQGLRLSYTSYVMLIAIAYVSKALSYPMFARLSVRWGSRKMLLVGGIAIVPMSAVWVISGQFWYLFLIQIVSGVAWACYELATALLIFEKVGLEERASVLSYYNLFQSSFVAGGALVGAGVLCCLTPDLSSYWLLFVFSTLLRGLTVTFLMGIYKVRWRFRKSHLQLVKP